MNLDTMQVISGTPPMEKISTEYLVWAPRKRKVTHSRSLDKKILKFEAEMTDLPLQSKEATPVQDPSSPIKQLELGFVKLRATLAPCKCYIEAESCGKPQCCCKKKHRKLFDEQKIAEGKKKISLKCTCPVECHTVLQSAQEMF